MSLDSYSGEVISRDEEDIVRWTTATCCVLGVSMRQTITAITSASSLLSSLRAGAIAETTKRGGKIFSSSARWT